MLEEESKWYEKLKKQCPNCKKYDAVEFLGEDLEFYNFGCKFCDFVKSRRIEFGPMAMGVNERFLKQNNLNRLF